MMDEQDEEITYEETLIEGEPTRVSPVTIVGPAAPPARPDNTLLYVAGAGAAAIGALIYFWPRGAPAAEPPKAPPKTPPSNGPSPGNGPSEPPPPPPPPPTDPIFGEVQFPPTKVGPQFDKLDRLATRAEERTGIDGLRDYLVAVASGESSFVPSALNDTTDGPGAFRLFCKENNFNGRFKDNPWRPKVCTRSDPRATRWAYSGGWFQMMTATALSTGDKVGYNMDPASLFVPVRAVAFASDLVNDFVSAWGAERFADIRAGWALPKWANADSTSEGKAKLVEKFKARLRSLSGRGVDPGLWNKRVTVKAYPGFEVLLRDLMDFEKAGE